MDEFSFIEYLRKKIPVSQRVSVGIGDDAAVLSVSKGKQLVVSTDVIVENVDFRIRKGARPLYREGGPGPFLAPEKVGRKALAINLSDLAAMGAKPVAFVISIGKPEHISTAWLKRFYNGLLVLAKQYGVACVGGDFSGAKEFFASVTIFGEALPHRIVKRYGAGAGDWIGVTGVLGGSILRHHHDFVPRIREGMFLAEKYTPTSMIDISDGLVQDLSHVLKASRVGAALDLDKIPVSSDAFRKWSGDVEQICPFSQALKRALSDGEDFELLFTVSPRKKKMLEKAWRKTFSTVPLSWIGKIEGRAPHISWFRDGKKVAAPKLLRKGFSHF